MCARFLCLYLPFGWSRCTVSVANKDLLRCAMNNKEVITHDQQFHSIVLGSREALDDKKVHRFAPSSPNVCSSQGQFLPKISKTAATGRLSGGKR